MPDNNSVTEYKKRAFARNQNLWKKYQGRTCKIKTGIIYPPGAGGNFLLTHLSRHEQETQSSRIDRTNTNEYFFRGDGAFSTIDAYPDPQQTFLQLPLLRTKYVEYLCDLYGDRWRSGAYPEAVFFKGHDCPTVMSMLYNIQMEDAVVIYDPEDWPMLSDMIKETKLFGTRDFNEHPYMISELFQFHWLELMKVDNIFPFYDEEFKSSHIHLSEFWPTLGYNSTYHWRYVLSNKIVGELSSPERAKEFITDFWQTYMWRTKAWTRNKQQTQFYKDAVDDMEQTYAETVTRIDYVDLFFKLEIPEAFKKHMLDQQYDMFSESVSHHDFRIALSEYSMNNLSQLIDILPFLPYEDWFKMYWALDKYRHYLEEANNKYKIDMPTEILDEKLEKYFYLWHKDKAPT